MFYTELVTEIEIDGKMYPITREGDFRVILDIIAALNDNELDEREKSIAALLIFYGEIPENAQEALDKLTEFINGGERDIKKDDGSPPLMDWEQDFSLIVASVNKVLGKEVRTPGEYTHWWTFLSAYNEIGECTFKDIVNIRAKRQRGERLDKGEQRYFRDNADRILIKRRLSQDDMDYLDGDY